MLITTLFPLFISLPVTTDVQNPRVRYINTNLNLSCNFAEGSTAEGCFFNFTGLSKEQSFFVNRTGDSLVVSACAVAGAVADNVDFTWSAFDDGGDIPIAVTLVPVDSQDQDNFECIPMAPGRCMQSMFIQACRYMASLPSKITVEVKCKVVQVQIAEGQCHIFRKCKFQDCCYGNNNSIGYLLYRVLATLH